MFWKLRIRPGEDERNVYAEAKEYGIICKPQDLRGIVERLDKYLKKQRCGERAWQNTSGAATSSGAAAKSGTNGAWACPARKKGV